MSLFTKRDRAQSLALFDVGTSSIGAALGIRTGHKTVRLLWHTRIEYGYTIQDDYERYVKAMGAQLLEAGMQIVGDGARIAHNNPHFSPEHLEVWCVYTPPWFYGGVGIDTEKQTDRRHVSHSTLDTMRSNILKYIETQPEYTAWQGVAGAHRLLEQIDLELELDGYRVAHTKQYIAREIKLGSYLSVVPQNIVDNVSDVLGKTFANNTVRMTTSTRLFAYQCAHNPSHAHQQTLLIEVGGQVTSVAVVRQGAPRGIATFPVGSHHLLHAIAPKSTSVEEAASTARNLILEHADSLEASMPQGLGTMLAMWQEELLDAIRGASNGITPPPHAAIAVETDWYPLFAHTLSKGVILPGVRETRKIATTHIYTNPAKTSEATLGSQGIDRRLATLLNNVHNVA